MSLRLLSYNVRSLRDDPAAVAAVIRACRPDVVAVQEAPRFTRWRSRCAALAHRSGLVVVTGGRPAGAMLLLAAVRVEVISTRDVLLPRRQGLHQRGVALATVAVDGERYTVGSIHLSLNRDERREQAGLVLDLVADAADPVILAGDVNEPRGGPAWRILADRLTDAGGGPTSPAAAPIRQIDGVFADPRLRVVSATVPALPEVAVASDHAPLLVELQPA